MIEPHLQEPSGCCGQPPAVLRGGSSDGSWIYACVGQLARVADQPALDEAHVCLQMELEAQRMITTGECLIGTHGCARKTMSLAGSLELISVPMQYWRPGQCNQRRPVAFSRQAQWAEANLLDAHRGDACAQRPCHKLCSEANPKDRLLGLNPPVDQLQFLDDERVGFIVESSDGTAQGDEQVGGAIWIEDKSSVVEST